MKYLYMRSSINTVMVSWRKGNDAFFSFHFFIECSAALGMASGAINNSQVTASSSLAPSYGPAMARLNSLSAWCASNGQSAQYIQVRH